MEGVKIPVDLENPGQVFACLGFVEAGSVLFGEAEGGFSWEGQEAKFALRAKCDGNPVKSILEALKNAAVVAFRPKDKEFNLEKQGIETRDYPSVEPGDSNVFAYPIDPPDKDARLVVSLESKSLPSVEVNYWGNRPGTDTTKFWTGNVTAPKLTKIAVECIEGLEGKDFLDPFNYENIQSSSFRLDWRRDYIALDAGFSPNVHTKVKMIGYPVVELLAAIGLTNSHPRPLGKSKLPLSYCYGVLGGGYKPISYLRAGLTGDQSPVPGEPFRKFKMELDWPAKEGQARCIIDVQELVPKEDITNE